MFIEGQKVLYAGETDPFNEVGSLGKVVALSGGAAHVHWLGGPKTGQFDLVEVNDLVAERGQATALLSSHQPYFGDSLDMAPEAVPQVGLPGLQVRAAYDALGEDGAVSALDETGVLATLASYAEEVVDLLIGKVGADAHMQQAMASLEQDEADTVVQRVVATLLTDRLKEA